MMDGKHNDLSQKIDNLHTRSQGLPISTQCKRKENFLLNLIRIQGIHEVEAQEGESSQMREVKAVITLRSGKEVDLPTPSQSKNQSKN
ncbi:hypothetical protein CK203_103789 [Vitis vinifera]|uniref:Uncharacterized protein n=1 Tax=Vitis vinifera TaxID=29760 RepID=A0A438CI55_VITVI|nr:hypothetical protein CK203_103789 [Vitis vinifera]